MLAASAWEQLAARWGAAPVHVPAAVATPALPGWAELNAVLETQRLERSRVLVGYHERVEVVQTRRDPRGHDVPWLDVPALRRALRAGASLVLFGADDAIPALRPLADELARRFAAAVELRLFATFPGGVPFGRHRDDEDQLVVQLAGRKRWRIDGADDLVLAPGDALHLPRGHEHDVEVMGEPTLHVTCAVPAQTGGELLAWMIREVCARSTAWRMDLPRFASADERRAHVARLRAELAAVWTDDAVARHRERRAADVAPRPHAGLPDTAAGDGLPDGDGAQVASCLRVRPAIVLEGDEVTFSAAGREWRLDAALAPLLRRILHGPPASLRALAAATELDPVDVRAVVAALADEGLIAVTR